MERNVPRLSIASLPPWLWFWLVVYVLSLPRVIHGLRQQHVNVLSSYETLPAGTITGLHVYFLSVLPQLLSTLALALGLFTVVVPWLRAAYLERRFRLKRSSAASPALEEIKNFIDEHAPGIEIKVNLIRTNQLAFVYPLGFRRTALAIFGGLVKLWRSDRQVAEAVLLHEIGHHRQGDTLIVGAGSFFEALARYWLFLGLLAVAVAAIDGAIISVQIADRLGHDLLTTLVSFVLWVMPEVFLEFTGVLFWILSALVIPVIGGIWCAELNADRFAVGAQGSSEHLSSALGKLAPHRSWWRWFLFRMYHPPQTVRRWAARRPGKTVALMTLLLIFPLAYVAKVATMSGWALSLYLSQCVLGCDLAAVWEDLSSNVEFVLGGYVRIWLAMAGLLLLWPVLSKYWEGIFTNKPGRRFASQPRSYRAYALSATLVCVLALSFYLLRLPG